MIFKRIKISEHFTYSKILIIALPTILGIFCWTSSIFIDGIFVSKFISNVAFQAYSVVTSYIYIFYALTFIPAYASFHLISKKLGENKTKDANELFFSLLFISIGLGILLTVLSLSLMKPILVLLKASGEVLSLAYELGLYIASGISLFTVYTFLKDADYISEKRTRSFICEFILAAIHLCLSILFIKGFNLGLKGIGLSTIISWGILCIYYLIYYFRKNNSLLQLQKTKFKISLIKDTFLISLPSFTVDFVSGIVALLATFQAYRYFQDIGGTANGLAFEIANILINIGAGLVMAIMPIFSYNLGSKNNEEIKSLFSKCIKLLLVLGILCTVVVEALSYPIASIYINPSDSNFAFIRKILMIYVTGCSLTFINYFISQYLVSIGKKKEALISSLSRVVILWPTMLYTLPLIFKNGLLIWASLIVTDVIMLGVNMLLLKISKKTN